MHLTFSLNAEASSRMEISGHPTVQESGLTLGPPQPGAYVFSDLQDINLDGDEDEQENLQPRLWW